MKQLKCPKCGNVFQVDEADYASIALQVKNAEFAAEVERRIGELHRQHDAERELAVAKSEQSFQTQLNQKQVELSAKDAEIERLKGQLEKIDAQKNSELVTALADKDHEIERLNSTISQNDNKLQLALIEERQKAQDSLRQKDAEILRLRTNMELERREVALNKEVDEKNHHDEVQKLRDEVAYYKDMKTRLSTKMVGETLEQHCNIQYEKYIRPFMSGAYFDKDNEVVEGTKGDFIFRDFDDGIEYISIMFEMKNEMDGTQSKHKNDDFLKKLDEDRKKKKCEFAVLVSMLEPENELYNCGIVDMSFRYDKTYVIRPQFFVPIIQLLVQTSKKSIEYKKQLIIAQSKDVDVTNFENRMEAFKGDFTRHCELASKKFEAAIKQIDETISKLQKMKENLTSWDRNLDLALKDTEDLTIRKLTYKNPTMRAKFAEARKAKEPFDFDVVTDDNE